MSNCWAIVTGEYPPQLGGVSDYTRLVADALVAAGDEVHIWAPALDSAGQLETVTHERGITVHRLPDHFGRHGIAALDKGLRQLPSNRRVLLQYVPHAFGYKAMNIPFCLWLWAKCPAQVWTMFHEVAFPWVASPLRHNVLAVATRLMALLVTRASQRMFISIPAWRDLLAPLAPRNREITWTPVPTNLPMQADEAAVAQLRETFSTMSGGGAVIGHFGSFCGTIVPQLQAVLPLLLRDASRRIVLIGRGSEEFARDILARCPELDGQVMATGALQSQQVADHLAACDVLVQPYPDGVSCRRSSLMASLALGLPIVTTSGALTESIWEQSGAVALASANDAPAIAAEVDRLLADRDRRQEFAATARSFYKQNFSIGRTIAALRQASEQEQGLLVGTTP